MSHVVPVGYTRSPMRRIKHLSAIPLALAVTALLTSVAAAGVGDQDTPINSCFGIVSGQRASTIGDTGTHASSFDEPRLGIGNLVFRVLGFSSVGEAGSALGSLDEFDTTHCN
jgi:hypothetical protein